MSISAATLSSPWPHSVAWAVRVFGPVAAVAGYTAGFSLLPHEWFHLGWLLVAGVVALFFGDVPAGWLRPAGVRPGVLLLAAYILWMTARSCWSDAFLNDQAPAEVFRGLVGTGLLVLLGLMLAQVAQNARKLCFIGWMTGLSAAFAALVSMAYWYLVLPGPLAGGRLQNILVHEGLNPICTGLIFGFAGVWLLALVEHLPPSFSRHLAWGMSVLLHLAAFYTGSRGVMLALLCGHLALFLARGLRRGFPALLVLLGTGLFYFVSAPLVAKAMAWNAPPSAAPPVPSITHHWEKAMERRDNGRLSIYRAGWNAVNNVWIGTGQWGVGDVWQCDLQPDPYGLMKHLHSAFFATFVHGGVVGAVLLLGMLACAACRAWRIAREGDAAWVALLAFGCGGLLFDGESLMSLATAPRYEGLLFWIPVVVALTLAPGAAATSRSAGS